MFCFYRDIYIYSLTFQTNAPQSLPCDNQSRSIDHEIHPLYGSAHSLCGDLQLVNPCVEGLHTSVRYQRLCQQGVCTCRGPGRLITLLLFDVLPSASSSRKLLGRAATGTNSNHFQSTEFARLFFTFFFLFFFFFFLYSFSNFLFLFFFSFFFFPFPLPLCVYFVLLSSHNMRSNKVRVAQFHERKNFQNWRGFAPVQTVTKKEKKSQQLSFGIFSFRFVPCLLFLFLFSPPFFFFLFLFSFFSPNTPYYCRAQDPEKPKTQIVEAINLPVS